MCGNLRKLQWRRQFTYLNGKWRFVRILKTEPYQPVRREFQNFGLLPSTYFPHLSQTFSTEHEYRITRKSFRRIRKHSAEQLQKESAKHLREERPAFRSKVRENRYWLL